jgi:hypothetical protein
VWRRGSTSSVNLLLKVVVQRVFVALADSKLDTFISPEALECVHAVQWHGIFGADLRVGSNDLCEALQCCQYTPTGPVEFVSLTMFVSCAKSTSCSSMAPKMTWNACRRLLKMVTFHCFRSEDEKPLVWRRRICLSTVDLPDSPAPFVLSVHH